MYGFRQIFHRILLVALLLAYCAPVTAHSPPAPDTVVIRARKGNVTFPHRMHEEAGLLKECTACHTDHQGDKLGKQGMTRGHEICRTCHATLQSGPRLCDDCHK